MGKEKRWITSIILRNSMRINENPLVKTFQYYAYAESVAMNHPSYEDWFANNYIQLIYYFGGTYEEKGLDFMAPNIFGNHSLINAIAREREDLKADRDLMEREVKEIFDQGYAIHTILDEYFVPNREHYKQVHQEHDILLYGYQNNNVQCIGYNQRHKYNPTEITFDELFQAMQNDNTHFRKISLDESAYSFQIDLFVFELKQYLYSIDSRADMERYYDMKKYHKPYFDGLLTINAVFGMDCYQALEDLLVRCVHGLIRYDVRTFYLLYEHKQSMYDKIEFLIKRGYLDSFDNEKEQYFQVVKLAETLKNTGIMYLMTHKKERLFDMKVSLANMKKIEQSVLERLLERLEGRSL